MKCLVIDACARHDSRTRKLYLEYIKNINYEVDILKLYDLDLKPLNENDIEKRYRLIDEGKTNDKMFYYSNQFKKYDLIIVAAPYWDLSFPSILKIYFEHVSVAGITFSYDTGRPVGLCKANELIYLSTAGGKIINHLGYEYVKALADLFGIEKTKNYYIDGLDIDPSKSDLIFEEKIKKIFK